MAFNNTQQTKATYRKKTNELIIRLEQIKIKFDKSNQIKKLSLINQLSNRKIYNAKKLLRYHDVISFLRAYPDNFTILKSVEKELKKIFERVDFYKQNTRDKTAAKLLNSGIINTTVEHAYSLGVLNVLLKKYSDMLSIDWHNILDSVPEELFSTLPLVVLWHENDALDNDDTTDIPNWLKIAEKNRPTNDVETLVNMFNSSNIHPNVLDYLFEKIDVPVAWALTHSQSSRTLKRLPVKEVFYQKEPLKKRTSNLRNDLTKPIIPLKLLSVKSGEETIQTANEVLAVRYRELMPITYANTKEVYVYKPGRGIQIYIFGSLPEVRLPLESNYGAMIIRNGLPIGYGVAACLFDRVEIAINIFPAFRTGESSYIIEQFLKLFHDHFNSRVFLVNSFQMGDGDDEPIHAGAFWFYYKLGFRAINTKIRSLAEKEYQKITTKKNYRSSFQTLKRLSKSDVYMHINVEQMSDWQDLSLMNLGYIVTKLVGSKYNGNRKLAVKKSIHKLEKSLNHLGWKNWTDNEITSLERMAPLIVNIPNLSKLSKVDKVKLVEIIKAKGSNQERKYTLLSNKHSIYKAVLKKLASKKQIS